MKYIKLVTLCVLWFLSLSNLVAQENTDQPLNCYTILVGKNASSDGSVLFAHNEDDGGRQVVNYFKIPRKEHTPGERVTFRRGGSIPQIQITAAYLWLNLPGMEVSDSYFNEYGVAIGSDGCSSRENNPVLKDGGLVYWLRRIVAERAHSARQGVKIAGKLIDEFGYASSGRTYGIADSKEAWMLSVVNGKHWIAERVPDDQVAILPNCYIIGKIDLSDTLNYLGSPDIIQYAISQGWYDQGKDGDFNFAKVYSNPGSLKHPGNTHRQWRGLNLLGNHHFDLEDDLPFSVLPAKKVTVQDLMHVLRDHYEGTMLDQSKNYTLGSPYKMNRATICANSTQYSFVVQLRDWLPERMNSLVWIAPFRPDVQAYVPWYVNTEIVPQEYAYKDGDFALATQFDPPDLVFDHSNTQAYWTFRSLVEKVDQDYQGNIDHIQAIWGSEENEFFETQQRFENKVKRMSEGKQIKLMTKKTNQLAEDIYKQTKDMLSSW